MLKTNNMDRSDLNWVCTREDVELWLFFRNVWLIENVRCGTHWETEFAWQNRLSKRWKSSDGKRKTVGFHGGAKHLLESIGGKNVQYCPTCTKKCAFLKWCTVEIDWFKWECCWYSFSAVCVPRGGKKNRGIVGTKVFLLQNEKNKLSLNVKLRSYMRMAEMGRSIHTRTKVDGLFRGGTG